MSSGGVTRSGSQNDSPARDGAPWDGGDRVGRGGERERGRARRPHDHPGDSYHGKPVINPPVWEELDIAGDLFLGGLAGASSLVAAGADLSGRPVLAQRASVGATAAIGVSFVALIHDLGRPSRFVNMLRVVKPSSPMSVGTWLLTAYAPLNFAATGSSLSGVARPAGRLAGVGAALLAPAVASYTAPLIANTAVPMWHGAHRELPFLFVSSAAAAGAGFGLVTAPRRENVPLTRLAVAGAVGELAVETLIERRLGSVAVTLHSGTAGSRLRAARACTAVGGLVAASLAPRSRVAAVAAGAALLAGSALTRFGIFAAGMASARDPQHTVQPQRERLRARSRSNGNPA